MRSNSVDAQSMLTKAFEDRHYGRFCEAIHLGADPNLIPKDDNGNQMTIYEKSLSTPGSFKFIIACINSGCDINYINTRLNKAAINYVADSRDDTNMDILLHFRIRNVKVDHIYEQETALHKLIKNLNGKDSESVIRCIRLLLSKGASTNTIDADGKTAFKHLLKIENIPQKTRKDLIYEFLACPGLSEAKYSEGVEYVLQNEPDGCSPMLYTALLRHLLKLNAEELLETLKKYENIRNWDKLRMQSELLNEGMPRTDDAEFAIYEMLEANSLKDNQSLLETAIQYRNEFATHALLRQGARLGWRNENKKLIIEDMDVKLLEDHFNYCITSRGKNINHERYELRMNLTNLTNKENELDVAPIAYMAKCKDLWPLLQHPLITCFLLLTWKRLSTIFYTHFLIFLVFGVALVAHALLRFPERTQNELALLIVRGIICLMIVYILVLDIASFLLVKDIPSFLHLPLIILLILMFLECGQLETQRTVEIVTIILTAWKLMLLIGDLPISAIATHMLMLRQVTRTFLCSLALYSTLVLTFVLIFYIQFSQPNVEADPNKFLTLALPGRMVMQTLIMFAGQYEYDDFRDYTGSVILLLFIFMTIILTNLLMGLAVNDTQIIQDQVELNAAICRTGLLSRYDAAFKINWKSFEWLRRCYQKLTKMEENITYVYLSILPNQGNKAIVCDGDVSLRTEYSEWEWENIKYYSTQVDDEVGVYCMENYKKTPKKLFTISHKELEIDQTTVNLAFQIIKRNSNKNIQLEHEKNTEKRPG